MGRYPNGHNARPTDWRTILLVVGAASAVLYLRTICSLSRAERDLVLAGLHELRIAREGDRVEVAAIDALIARLVPVGTGQPMSRSAVEHQRVSA
jgi:hypothetical protein